jgi:hypothetical protein
MEMSKYVLPDFKVVSLKVLVAIQRNGSGERIRWRIQGLGEFACGVNLNNFAHKLLVKLFIIPPYIISPSHNLVAAILPSEIRNL